MPDRWDRRLETKINSVINRLREHNFTLLRENLESTDDTVCFIIFDTLKVRFINNDVAWYVGRGHTLESLHLADHELAVFLDSSWLDFLEHCHIRCPASNENLRLHHLNESLDEEILEEFLVDRFVLLDLISQLRLCLGLQVLDILVYFAHSGDPHLVLFLRLLDLQSDLLVLQVGLEVVVNDLLLLLEVFHGSDREFLRFTLLDASNLFITVLVDERDHIF